MRIYFKHGLYRAEKDSSGNPALTNSTIAGLQARVSNSPIVWSIAHHEKNYTVSEYQPVVFGSPTDLNAQSQCWLYVDLSLSTGQKTYGITYVEPVYGAVQPSSPSNDQHWFDTVNLTTKVFIAATNRWHERVRLVFGRWDTLQFHPIAFGTSVGITTPGGVNSGTIVYDAAGKVLKDSRDRFVTTEDKMFSDSAATHEFSLESNYTRATADENIPAFHVVKWSDFDTVQLAGYNDTSDAVIAIALNSATKGNPVELCIQGKIINDAWNWPTVNAELWILANGEFSAVDPFDIGGHTKRRVPVARVVDRNTIIFDQGLGGMGEKGDAGDVVGLFDASDAVKGITKLSIAPNDPTNPIAVGVNDPILTAPRVPLEHGHPATEISVSPFGAFTGSNTQQALLYIFNSKLSLTGGTVTGNITSTVGAVNGDHLTTLNDVRDELASYGLLVKHLDLRESTQPTLVQAFNQLTTNDRTFAPAEVGFILYGTESYVWLGGTGGPLTATDAAQFGLIGSFSQGGGAVNVLPFNGAVDVTEPVAPFIYTVFGDQRNSFPSIRTTDRTTDYVKTYIAGIFDVNADLATIQERDVRIGVIYQGDDVTGVAKMILNGEVIEQQTLVGGTQGAEAWWETAYRDNIEFLKPGCFLSEFGFAFDQGELYLGSDNVRSFYTFDNKDVKFGWLVEQETGTEQIELNNPIYMDMPIMYTAVTPNVSEWTELATVHSSPTEPVYNYYDRPTSVGLKIKLGGDPAAWQTALPEGWPTYQAVYTSFGFPTAPAGDLVHNVCGALFDTTTTVLDTWSVTDIFPVTGAVLANYIIPDQTVEAPSTWVGERIYPGIASLAMFPDSGGQGYVQALNTGGPVSFELSFVPIEGGV